jgi:DNA-directed RNA polymerase subunit RPC12/RpoP
MSEPEIVCPSCHSEHVVKNGRIHNGKQNYRCYDCRRQFVLNPQNKVIAQETKTLQAVEKDTEQTNYVERFNCTLRQRVSRLVRKTFSFSKKLENHIGAILYFIHHYNASLRL